MTETSRSDSSFFDTQITYTMYSDSVTAMWSPNGFQCFSHPVLSLRPHHLNCLPAWLVIWFPSMCCYAILSVIGPHCIFMFNYSLLQGSTCLSNVSCITVPKWNPVDSILLLCIWCFSPDIYQGLLQCPAGFNITSHQIMLNICTSCNMNLFYYWQWSTWSKCLTSIISCNFFP